LTRYEVLAFAAYAVMVVLTITIAVWRRRLGRQFAVLAPRPHHRVVHVIAFLALLFLAHPFLIQAPALALIPTGLFLLAGGMKLVRPETINRRVAGILFLCALVWLACWVVEAQLLLWMDTVIAPIRADPLFTAPVLYSVTVMAFDLINATKPGNTGAGPAGAS
jgi:hypothetical protein